MTRRWRAGVAVLILLALAPLACQERERAQALAAAGSETALVLADYYDGLAAATTEIEELEAFQAALRGVPLGEDQAAPLHEQRDALAARARLARRLAATYDALGRLASRDPAAEAGEAGAALGEAIAKLPPIASARVQPGSILSAAVADLARLRQSRDLRQGSRLVGGVVDRIAALLAAEEEACRAVVEERASKRTAVAEHLIRTRLVAATPLLESIPAGLGLRLTSSTRPPEDDATNEALLALARVRLAREGEAAAAAGESVSEALAALRQGHDDLLAGRAPRLARWQAAIDRTRLYLDALRELRGGPGGKER